MASHFLDSQESVHLYVHGVFPDGTIQLVGRLLSESNRLRTDTAKNFFQYSPEFLASDKAYSIDPAGLPLRAEVYVANSIVNDIPWVFDDSLPGSWGRSILAKRSSLELSHCSSAKLLWALGGDGLGRFIYSDYAETPAFTPDKSSIEFKDIKLALDEAEGQERSIDIDGSHLRHLLACGSSAGGARPKVLAKYEEGYFIAKLASIYDKQPTLHVNLELAGMTLARKAGLHVPEVRREVVGGRSILLVKRFDCTPRGGRNALMSARTLLNSIVPYGFGYKDVAGLIKRFSVSPSNDLPLFYKQMCVNVFLRNTDDHLQNFSFLHTEDGWGLSPVYDMVPIVQNDPQILMVNGKKHNITPADMVESGVKEFGFSKRKAQSLFSDTQEALQCWKQVFGESGVDIQHTGALQKDIGDRLSAKLSCTVSSSLKPC